MLGLRVQLPPLALFFRFPVPRTPVFQAPAHGTKRAALPSGGESLDVSWGYVRPRLSYHARLPNGQLATMP